jgi:hypothetical protein
MRFINSKLHAVIDYASGLFMLGLPGIINIADQSPAIKWMAMLAGIVILLQAMLTSYEGGIVSVIPLYVHLIVDIVLGFGLIISPWLVGFTGKPRAVFLVMGILAILFGLFTKLKPLNRRKIHNNFN